MFTTGWFRRVAIGSLAALACSAGSASAQSDARAVALLKALNARLDGARTLSFVAEDTSDTQSPAKPTTGSRIEVSLVKPDWLRLNFSSDASSGWIDCNSRTMTRYLSHATLIIERAPPRLDSCVRAAFGAAGLETWRGDFILSILSGNPIVSLKRVQYIGGRLIDGTQAEGVMFSRDDASVELWVDTSDRLPRVIRTVDTHRTRRTVTLSEWRIDATLPLTLVTSSAHSVADDAAADAAGDGASAAEPQAVGTTGIERVPSQPFTLYPYVDDFWRAAVEERPPATQNAPYYHSPDGFGYAAPGEVLTTLPAGCAAPYQHGPAFYLCGNTWFAAVYGPDGVHYYKVVSPP